jgi:hypothetical protein
MNEVNREVFFWVDAKDLHQFPIALFQKGMLEVDSINPKDVWHLALFVHRQETKHTLPPHKTGNAPFQGLVYFFIGGQNDFSQGQ